MPEDDRARFLSRGRLRVKAMAQPKQQPFGQRKSITPFEREADVQWRSDRYNNVRRELLVPHHIEPERRKTGNPRVLQNWKGRIVKFRLIEFVRSLFESRCRGRGQPTGIERTPVIPG